MTADRPLLVLADLDLNGSRTDPYLAALVGRYDDFQARIADGLLEASLVEPVFDESTGVGSSIAITPLGRTTLRAVAAGIALNLAEMRTVVAELGHTLT